MLAATVAAAQWSLRPLLLALVSLGVLVLPPSAPAKVRLPAELWPVSVARPVAQADLARWRKAGLNAVVVAPSFPRSEVNRLRTLAGRAHLLVLVPRAVAQPAGRLDADCRVARAQHPRQLCAVQVAQGPLVRQLASSRWIDVVVVPLGSPAALGGLAASATGPHVIGLVPLASHGFSAAPWRAAIARARQVAGLDLAVAPRDAAAVSRFTSLLPTSPSEPSPAPTLPSPSNPIITATTSTSIAVSWTPSLGAVSYNVLDASGAVIARVTTPAVTVAGLACGRRTASRSRRSTRTAAAPTARRSPLRRALAPAAAVVAVAAAAVGSPATRRRRRARLRCRSRASRRRR
jgi:hypothetical protein